MFLVVPMFAHIGIECSLDAELDQLLAQGSENLFGLDVFGQHCSQCFEFLLVYLLTHEGILLKKLIILGWLHDWVYRLQVSISAMGGLVFFGD